MVPCFFSLHIHTLFHSLTHSYTLTHSLSFSLSHTHSLTHSHTHTYTDTLTHSLLFIGYSLWHGLGRLTIPEPDIFHSAYFTHPLSLYLTHPSTIDVSPEDIDDARSRLSQNIDSILSLKSRILAAAKPSTAFSTSAFFSSTIFRVFSRDSGAADSLASMHQRLTSLETLNKQLYLDLAVLSHSAQRHAASTTVPGQARNLVAVLLSVYGLNKVLTTALHLAYVLVTGASRSGVALDPLSNAARWVDVEGVVGRHGGDWHRAASFGVVGVLVAVNVRGLLIAGMKVRL